MEVKSLKAYQESLLDDLGAKIEGDVNTTSKNRETTLQAETLKDTVSDLQTQLNDKKTSEKQTQARIS